MNDNFDSAAIQPSVARRQLRRFGALAILCACLAPLSGGLSAQVGDAFGGHHDHDREHDRGRDIDVPPVPGDIAVEAGHKAFLLSHAVGTQNYMCLAAATPTGVAWAPQGPQATLFDDEARQVATHYLSANPDEAGTFRATWQHSDDTSRVWAIGTGTSSDPAFVELGAIPWLRLKVVGWERGPRHGQRLLHSVFLQRVNTSGGAAPATGCMKAVDIGGRVFVPYTADYIFYKQAGRR